MLFVTLMKGKPGSTIRDRTLRRLEWTYPEGMRPLHEYWVASGDPEVVLICEAESPTVLIHAISQWDDVFEFRVFPAVTSEEGIAHARQELAAARV